MRPTPTYPMRGCVTIPPEANRVRFPPMGGERLGTARRRASRWRSSNVVDPDRVVAEERFLLVRREVGDDVAESAEDRREARAEAVDREVAREHAAPDAEAVERRAHDVAVRLGRPRAPRLAD